MSADAQRAPGQHGAAGAAQALLALLPALVLSWPFAGSPLAHDLVPRATGFGLAALLALPSAMLLVLRRQGPAVEGFALLAAPLLATALWLGLGLPSDAFEADRATVAWVTFVALALCGAGAASPLLLARGAALVGLLFALGGLAAPHAGALGNSGATSEAATLGAGAGLALLLLDRGAFRVTGALAIAAFLAHALLAPVLAGALSLGAASAALALARTGRQRTIALAVGALALLAALAPVALHRTSAPAAAPGPAPARVEASPAGGAAVRASVLRASLTLLAAHPLAGVGPGQFAAEFPPFRDPAEIERSSHGRALDAETEVEHAHDDWLQPALEGGVLAGLAWIAFLLLAARAAWRALRGADTARAALGAGVLAVLVHALARAPITADAASATLFAACAGALLARPDAGRPAAARRFVAVAAALLLLAFAPRAWSLVRHGYALQGLEQAEGDPERVERRVRRAAEAAPDSVTVRTLDARLAMAHGEGPERVAARWREVLAVRPHRVEALVQLGVAEAQSEDLEAARAALVRALELDPGNPAALQDLAAVELKRGELERGLALLDRLPPAHAPDAHWLAEMAARLALRGLEPESEALFARAGPEFAARTPEQRYALSKEARKAGHAALGDGWEARAQRGWADQHAQGGRWTEAVRSLRQDLRLCTERPGPAPVRVRLALAAALVGAGREAEAREQADGLTPTPRDVRALPGWARERLQAAGLLP